MSCPHCGGDVPLKDPSVPSVQATYCSENCRKRAHEETRRRPCPRCGKPMAQGTGYESHRDHAERCMECRRADEAERKQARIVQVAEMYAAGKSMRDISIGLGRSPTSKPWEVTAARRQGLIGYRNRGYSV